MSDEGAEEEDAAAAVVTVTTTMTTAIILGGTTIFDRDTNWMHRTRGTVVRLLRRTK